MLERRGDAIRFHPTLLDFAGHYRYEPRPVAVARGNEKGRVERAIRYVRDNFFAARSFTDLDDLNAQAEAWYHGTAADRRCPEDQSLSVRQAFAEEAPQLLKLPDNPYPNPACRPRGAKVGHGKPDLRDFVPADREVVEQVTVKVGKTPYARFDLNDYSVPHTHVRRPLTVLAEPDRLRIVDGENIIATHPRSYGRGEQIEDPAHLKALADQKRASRRHRATDRLAKAAPASQSLLVRAAERGDNLGAITAALIGQLEQYGANELQAAILEALERNAPHPNAVRLALERRREDRQQAPPVALILPDHVRGRDATVRPHDLDTYDQLTETAHDES